jgi:DNA-binding MarR family transcriptional regulator
MSEYAVERARQMFQARQSRRSRRPVTRERQVEPDTRPEGDAENLIGRLHLAYARLRQVDGWLREQHQLNLTEMHVLSLIPPAPPTRRAAGHGDVAARLAREVGLSPSGLTRLVNRLVKRGLLARVDDAWDKRVTRIVLTEQGRAVRDTVLPRAIEHLRGNCGPDQVPLEQLHGIPGEPRA